MRERGMTRRTDLTFTGGGGREGSGENRESGRRRRGRGVS